MVTITPGCNSVAQGFSNVLVEATDKVWQQEWGLHWICLQSRNDLRVTEKRVEARAGCSSCRICGQLVKERAVGQLSLKRRVDPKGSSSRRKTCARQDASALRAVEKLSIVCDASFSPCGTHSLHPAK